MPVDQVADLVDVGGREAIRVGFVVVQLSIDIVVNVPLFEEL
jgi:hypothetical protein